jgi:hypothetical protein
MSEATIHRIGRAHANTAEHSSTDRIHLAVAFEDIAARLRSGVLAWDAAVVVFHDPEGRCLLIESHDTERASSIIARENAALSALQRAAVRLSIPIE